MNFKICDTQFAEAAKRLCPLLGFELGEGGITVKSVQGERLGVSLKGKEATIYYNERYQFFRELSILVARAKAKDAFDLSEDTFFKSPCVMLDASRGGNASLSHRISGQSR